MIVYNAFAMSHYCPPLHRLFYVPRADTLKELLTEYIEAGVDKKRKRKSSGAGLSSSVLSPRGRASTPSFVVKLDTGSSTWEFFTDSEGASRKWVGLLSEAISKAKQATGLPPAALATSNGTAATANNTQTKTLRALRQLRGMSPGGANDESEMEVTEDVEAPVSSAAPVLASALSQKLLISNTPVPPLQLKRQIPPPPPPKPNNLTSSGSSSSLVSLPHSSSSDPIEDEEKIMGDTEENANSATMNKGFLKHRLSARKKKTSVKDITLPVRPTCTVNVMLLYRSNFSLRFPDPELLLRRLQIIPLEPRSLRQEREKILIFLLEGD